jgi:hypothetical protein
MNSNNNYYNSGNSVAWMAVLWNVWLTLISQDKCAATPEVSITPLWGHGKWQYNKIKYNMFTVLTGHVWQCGHHCLFHLNWLKRLLWEA